MKFAVSEGGTKTVSAVAMKYVGMAINSVPIAFLFVLAVGTIQMVGGVLGALVKRDSLRPPEPKAFVAASLFGVTATAMSVLAVYTFMIGADLGVRTFIITMAIIPGALIDWVFFSHPLNKRQGFGGISMYLLAGWCILDFPSTKAVLQLPTWVWLTLVIALLAAVNEGLSQATAQVKKFNAMPNNFWVGLATIVCCGLVLLFMGNIVGVAASAPGTLWVGVVIAGAAVLAMISFKLLAYKGGGSIVLKKVIMKGTYLITAALAGVILYHEPVTVGKLLGVVGFFAAFTIMDNETWDFVTQKFKPAVALE